MINTKNLTPSASPIIQLEELSYTYYSKGKRVPVLHNINIQVAAGEMVAIEGRSGSGKSTLLYLLGATLKIQSGPLKIGGVDLKKMSDLELANFRNRYIGFVFQQFHLLPHTQVKDNILLPLFYSNNEMAVTAKEKSSKEESSASWMQELVRALDIEQVLNHYPNELSGGQQQRTAIARALIKNPEIILADEPTGNLDSKTADEIVGLLKKLNQNGKTVILVTHDHDLAKECDRIYRIHDGRIVEQETARKKAPAPASARAVLAPPPLLLPHSPRPSFAPKISLPQMLSTLPIVMSNIRRNKIRAILTMLGITIGIAAMISMITLGLFL